MCVFDTLSPSEANDFDYLVIGGGTAGCVVAARLAEYLPHKKVLLIEAGPSDFKKDEVLLLKEWLNLLGGDLDYGYTTVEQPMGNSHIQHSRAKVLGGCSSHNTLISFRPFEYDMRRWQNAGCAGWTFPEMVRLTDKLRNSFQPVHHRHRNQLCRDWVKACSTSLGVPIIENFNEDIRRSGCLKQGVGFFNVSYNPDDGRRSSASVAYIHPILRGDEERPNLKVLTHAWVSRVNVNGSDVEGVDIRLQSGQNMRLKAKKETVICAGAIDTPRLLMLSGIGPKQQLQDLGISVVRDVPGMGENLVDHPESIIMWELSHPVPPNQTTMDSDAGIFIRREPANAAGDDGDIADLMMHCYQVPFTLNLERLGYDKPADGYAFCMTPNIPRPRSRGRLYLTSKDPKIQPALDFRYFTDPEGYDAATIVAGLKYARKVAQQEPFKGWIKREVAPGPKIQTDEELSEYGRRAAHTVYHPAGTTKMGDLSRDPLAVVDPSLKLRSLNRIRIADAGVFPEIPTINPMLTVLAVGERCAEMIAEEAGWRRSERARL